MEVVSKKSNALVYLFIYKEFLNRIMYAYTIPSLCKRSKGQGGVSYTVKAFLVGDHKRIVKPVCMRQQHGIVTIVGHIRIYPCIF